MLTPEASILAGRIIGNLLADDVHCIGGPATAAIPVVTAVVHQSLVPRTGFYVRPEAKGYGLLNRIKGNLEPQVAIVDDTCYTGASNVSCIQAVEEAGSVVRQVVAVFDRGNGGERIRELGYDYRYVLRIEAGEPRLPAGPVNVCERLFGAGLELLHIAPSCRPTPGCHPGSARLI